MHSLKGKLDETQLKFDRSTLYTNKRQIQDIAFSLPNEPVYTPANHPSSETVSLVHLAPKMCI